MKNMNFEEARFRTSADKKYGGIVNDPGKKLTKKFEDAEKDEKRESAEGFEWEKSLKLRFQELSLKDSKQGLSEHGKKELEKLRKVIEVL
jgi:hypothetical protein